MVFADVFDAKLVNNLGSEAGRKVALVVSVVLKTFQKDVLGKLPACLSP